MKKLLLLLAMLFAFTACEDKEKVMALVDFNLATDGTPAELSKIEELFKTKGLPVGRNVEVVVEGTTDLKKMDEQVQRMLTEMTIVLKPQDIQAVCPSGSYVRYEAYYSMSSGHKVGEVTMRW